MAKNFGAGFVGSFPPVGIIAFSIHCQCSFLHYLSRVPGVLIGNWREDAYGKDLALSRMSSPQVFSTTWETTSRAGFRAPECDALVQKTLTPLEVCHTGMSPCHCPQHFLIFSVFPSFVCLIQHHPSPNAALSPASFETLSAPLSISTNVVAVRPPPDTIDACAVASNELSVRQAERKGDLCLISQFSSCFHIMLG